MTITEFISQENTNKENPFEGCDIKKTIGIDDYINMAKAAESIAFNAETKTYRSLFREMAIRTGIIGVILNLEMDDGYDIDRLFEVIICSNLYDKFFAEVALKVAPDMYAIIDGIEEYLDDKVAALRSNNLSTEQEALNTLTNLLNNEAFQNILEQIAVIESEKVTEVNG